MDLFEGGFVSHSPQDTDELGFSLSLAASGGDVFLLDGPLGAGKTTFVRGFMRGLGHTGAVRSPTFNLIQTFETNPPVMHADLYRVSGLQGLGLEEYLDTHICLIEWPDRAKDFFVQKQAWRLSFALEGEMGRRIQVKKPADE